MTVVNLNNISISSQLSTLAHSHIILTRILGKSPLQTLENLLPSGELELATTNGFNNMGLRSILCSHREKDLSNVYTSCNTNGLSVRMPHTAGKPIGSSAGKHFVGTDNVKGVHTDSDVVSILSNSVGQVLVDGNTAGLKSLGGDLLLLVTDQVSNEGEKINRGFLGSDIINLNLRFGHTTAVARLDVGFVLLVAVTAEGTATHVGKFDE